MPGQESNLRPVNRKSDVQTDVPPGNHYLCDCLSYYGVGVVKSHMAECTVGRGRGRRGLSKPQVSAHTARAVCWAEPVTSRAGTIMCRAH